MKPSPHAAKKGWRPMHPSPHSAAPLPSRTPLQARPVEDVVYQAVTVGAILLVIASVWIF